MFVRKTLLSSAAALAVLPFATVAQEHPEKIHVHDAYARLSPQSGAVFFMIHNNTEADITLVGAHTDLAEKAELHTHTEGADGVMVMSKIEGGVPLASGEMHLFARGGDHVMLMGLTRKLVDGDSFDLVLDLMHRHDSIEATAQQVSLEHPSTVIVVLRGGSGAAGSTVSTSRSTPGSSWMPRGSWMAARRCR